MRRNFIAVVWSVFAFAFPAMASEGNGDPKSAPAIDTEVTLPEFVPLANYDQFMLACADSAVQSTNEKPDAPATGVRLAELSIEPSSQSRDFIPERAVITQALYVTATEPEPRARIAALHSEHSAVATRQISLPDAIKSANPKKTIADKPAAKKRVAHKPKDQRQGKPKLTNAKQGQLRKRAKPIEGDTRPATSSSFGSTFDRLVQSLF